MGSLEKIIRVKIKKCLNLIKHFFNIIREEFIGAYIS